MTMMPFKGRCHTCGHDHDSDEEMFAGLRELMKPERDATIESQAAQIAALTAERDAMLSFASWLRAQFDALAETDLAAIHVGLIREKIDAARASLNPTSAKER